MFDANSNQQFLQEVWTSLVQAARMMRPTTPSQCDPFVQERWGDETLMYSKGQGQNEVVVSRLHGFHVLRMNQVGQGPVYILLMGSCKRIKECLAELTGERVSIPVGGELGAPVYSWT